MADDFNDAKATLYRDLATIYAILLGFLSVALSFGNVNTNPLTPQFVAYQHPALFVAAVVVGVGLLWSGGKMVQYDRNVVETKRPKA